MGILNKENLEKAVDFERNVQQKAKDTVKELGGTLSVNKKEKIVDNVVCFTNCNGGTGVSTLVSNLVYAETNGNVVKGGLNILVIDLNIMYPTLDIYFADDKIEYDMYDFLTGKCNLGQAVNNNGNVSLLYFRNRGLTEYINCEDSVVLTNFKEMLDKIRNLYDFIFIDCPMRIEHLLVNSALYECDTIYNVWDEGIASVVNTDKTITQMMISGISGREKMYIIMNKRTDIRYNKALYSTLKLECVGELPYSKSIIHSSIEGLIFCKNGKAEDKEGSLYEKEIYNLASVINRIGGYNEQ